MNSMHHFASHYQACGWSIFPVETGGKKPLVKWKAFQMRLPTEAEIAEWFSLWPDANIAVALGAVSGIVVVDVDSLDAEQALLDCLGDSSATRSAVSGSHQPGKMHLYFQAPEFPTTASFKPLHPQLELRGQGGTVILPPSLHVSGHRYEWQDSKAPILPLPERLAEIWQANPRLLNGSSAQTTPIPIIPTENVPRTLFSMLHTRGLSPETQQWLMGQFAYRQGWNSRLYRAACDMNGCGVPYEPARVYLLRGARPRTPSDRDQAIATIDSAYSSERLPSSDFFRR